MCSSVRIVPKLQTPNSKLRYPISSIQYYLCRKLNDCFMAARTDHFVSPDYFNVDELLTDEHKLIRESVRSYVKKEISPIIEDYAQRAEFPRQIIKQLGSLGCFGPTIPHQYGGGGLDYTSYGL